MVDRIETEAYDEGQEAFHSRKSFEDNPYDFADRKATAWYKGFFRAEKAMKERNSKRS